MMAPRTVTESIGGFVSRAAPSGAPTSTGYTDGSATQTQPCGAGVRSREPAPVKAARRPLPGIPGPRGRVWGSASAGEFPHLSESSCPGLPWSPPW